MALLQKRNQESNSDFLHSTSIFKLGYDYDDYPFIETHISLFQNASLFFPRWGSYGRFLKKNNISSFALLQLTVEYIMDAYLMV